MTDYPSLETGPSVSCLVIPIKSSVGSKQRLAAELPADVRQLVSRALASRMVRCAAEGWAPSRVVVVGDDPEVTDLCRRLGVATIGDFGGGQSDAVRAGQAWCLEQGATTLATVAADLPQVESVDLRRLWQTADDLPSNSLALIPDRGGSGTNGMLVRPADRDTFLFGPDSLRLHFEVGARLGLQVSLLDLPSLTWDIDRPEDLVPPDWPTSEGVHPVVAWAREVAALGVDSNELEARFGH
ncbi:MAG: 2-phospho-L-lactate guanylyltransferase [Candidatus Dormiibacterota bacterium]